MSRNEPAASHHTSYMHHTTMQDTLQLAIHHTCNILRCRTLYSSPYITHTSSYYAGRCYLIIHHTCIILRCRTLYSSPYIIHATYYNAGHSAARHTSYIHHTTMQDTLQLAIHHTCNILRCRTLYSSPYIKLHTSNMHHTTMQDTLQLAIHHTYIMPRCRTLYSSSHIIHTSYYDAGHSTTRHTSQIHHTPMQDTLIPCDGCHGMHARGMHVTHSCHVMSCHSLMSCHVMSCHVMSSPLTRGELLGMLDRTTSRAARDGALRMLWAALSLELSLEPPIAGATHEGDGQSPNGGLQCGE